MSDDLSETDHDAGSEAGDDAAHDPAAHDPAAHDATDANLRTPTGVPTVDAAVERLAELDALPTGEHVAIYDAVHRQLQDALADLDGS